MQNSYNTGDVSGEDSVGGVVGGNDGTVQNSYNTGDVSGIGHVGGVAGNNRDTVQNCYNTGDVSGTDYVGGVVGFNIAGTLVQNSYNTGGVSGNGHVGGVVGYNSYGTVQNSYNTGDVSGEDTVGGVVGCNSYGTVQSTYFLKEISGINDGIDGIGLDRGDGEATAKTTIEMQSQDFTNLLNDWVIENRGTISGLYFWLQETTTSYPSLKEAYVVTVTDGSVSNYKGIAFVGNTVNLTPNTVEGKVFSSWSVTPNTVTVTNNSFTMPSEDVMVTGIYKDLFTATFNLNGGNISGSTTDIKIYAKVDDTVVMPSQNPMMSGYTFEGWFTEMTGGTEITTATKLTKDTTFYAQWTKTALLPQTLSFSQSEVKKVANEGKFTNTLTGVKTEVTYTSTNEDVAKVDPKTGEVMVVSAGTTNIIATATKDLTYDMATASYKLTVDSVKALSFDEIVDYVASFDGNFDELAKIYFNGVELTLKKIDNDTYELMGYPQGSSTVIGKAERGSIVVTLYKEFLKTLPAGNYDLVITLNGAPTVPVGSTVVSVPEGAPTATPTPTTAPSGPQTGDYSNPILIVGVMTLSLAAVVVLMRRVKILNSKNK